MPILNKTKEYQDVLLTEVITLKGKSRVTQEDVENTFKQALERVWNEIEYHPSEEAISAIASVNSLDEAIEIVRRDIGVEEWIPSDREEMGSSDYDAWLEIVELSLREMAEDLMNPTYTIADILNGR